MVKVYDRQGFGEDGSVLVSTSCTKSLKLCILITFFQNIPLYSNETSLKVGRETSKKYTWYVSIATLHCKSHTTYIYFQYFPAVIRGHQEPPVPQQAPQPATVSSPSWFDALVQGKYNVCY